MDDIVISPDIHPPQYFLANKSFEGYVHCAMYKCRPHKRGLARYILPNRMILIKSDYFASIVQLINDRSKHCSSNLKSIFLFAVSIELGSDNH